MFSQKANNNHYIIIKANNNHYSKYKRFETNITTASRFCYFKGSDSRVKC